MKRVLDSALSLIALVVLAPLLGLIALVVKVDSPGPVLFIQKRVGRGRELFPMYKFRTMRVETPSDVPTHLLSGADSHLTRAGRLLRALSLDELPQLVNILKGDMSFVGPRPALWNQDDLIAEREQYGANDVRPGLTGWAQINGRDELSIAEKSALDGYYMRHQSLLFDLKCVLGTIVPVLRGRGVVEGSRRVDGDAL